MALFLPLDRWCWELWVYFPILQLQPLGDLCNTKRQRYLSCNERFRKKLLKILHTDLKIKLPSKNIIQSFHAWLEKSQNLCPKVCRGETSRNLCCPRTEEHNRLLGFFYTKWQIEFLLFSYLKGNNCFITYTKSTTTIWWDYTLSSDFTVNKTCFHKIETKLLFLSIINSVGKNYQSINKWKYWENWKIKIDGS